MKSILKNEANTAEGYSNKWNVENEGTHNAFAIARKNLAALGQVAVELDAKLTSNCQYEGDEGTVAGSSGSSATI